jgi:filamentous hemagglutinin
LNSTQGTATLAAGRDLQLGTSESAHSDYTKVVTHKSGFFSSSTTTDISSHDSTTLNSTQLAANQVNLQAGRDVVVTASNVNATGALNAAAQRDIDLQAQTRKDASSYFHQEQKSGLSASMLTGIQFGSSQSQESDKSKASLQTGSTLSGQNVTLTAGRDATASAASVLADQNLQVQAGRNVNILAATNTLETTHQASASSTVMWDWFPVRPHAKPCLVPPPAKKTAPRPAPPKVPACSAPTAAT